MARTARQIIERADALLAEADALMSAYPVDQLTKVGLEHARAKTNMARALTYTASVMADVEAAERTPKG